MQFFLFIELSYRAKCEKVCSELLRVLDERWLKTEEGLDGARFASFFCKVGMGGEGCLCRTTTRFFLCRSLTTTQRAEALLSFQAYCTS